MGGALGVLLLVSSAAWACVSLATLDLSPGSGVSGDTVKATGTGFNSNTTYSDIELRWGGADGPILATIPKPASGGNVSFSFKVPDAAPGTYVMLANQLDSSGVPLWGLPARVTFTVLGAAAGTVPTEVAAAPQTVTVEQRYLVAGPTAAPAPAATPAPAAQQQVTAAQAQPVTAPAPEAAKPVLSLEARDAINEVVVPAGARDINYVPASSRAQSSNTLPLRAGLAMALLGSMALLTAAGAALILRPSKAGVR